MTPNTYSETQQQNNCIQLLQAMGYQFISRQQNVNLRHNKLGEVLFKDILQRQLQKINSFSYKGETHKFSDKNIAKAMDELDVPLVEGLQTVNQQISDKLILGTSFDESPAAGVKKSFSLQYIDFKTPSNNAFHFTEEFAVNRQNTMELEKTRRPDLVLFLNGIPIAVIELKKPSIAAEQAISQMLRNQGENEIPQLFKFIAITVAGNNHSCEYATTGTPRKFYGIWREQETAMQQQLTNLLTKRTVSNLDQMLHSLFSKHRLLELLHSYIIFDNKTKKIARYQQFFAVKQIIAKINSFNNKNNRNGGLIWHTPGSGKSLTMVALTKIIKREIAGAKIIVVTDRTDLDRQIHNTFHNSEITAGRANSGSDLIAKLQSGFSVITTLVHKFETVRKEKVVLNSNDIFALVDESHRTQNGNLNRAMQKVFPNACYLGFTGTPLLKKDKKSIAKFGGLIHKYTIEQAVKDKTVLPLLYEGRLVDQWLNDKTGLDRKFNIISRNLNDEQTLDLKQKWSRFQKVASSERRLEVIALDINQHFIKSEKNTGFKAMLATNSKYEAIKYHSIFADYGDIKTAFIISPPDNIEGHSEVDDDNKQAVARAWQKIIKEYGSENQYLSSVKDKFVNGDDIDLLIVVDKLLTGFDAPRAKILYLDKELREHSLLQAISRVNRLYTGKDYGIIIDYRGLLGNLDQALTDYQALDGFDKNDLVNAVIDIKQEIAKVKTYYSDLTELFKKVAIQYNNDQESYQVFLGDKAKRNKFYELLSLYARSLKLALSSDKLDAILSDAEIAKYIKTMKFYSELRKSLRLRYHEAVDFGKYEQQMQKLLDTFISAEATNQLTKLVNIFEDGFKYEVDRIVGDNAKADAIISATTKVITDKREQNPAYYDKLSKRIQEILEQYKQQRISDKEKLSQAEAIQAILAQQNQQDLAEYPQQIQNNATRAFYDNLPDLQAKLAANIFVTTVCQINAIYKQGANKPDWQNNIDVKNAIDQKIDDILWQLEDEHSISFDSTDAIIKQARQIGISNYASQ